MANSNCLVNMACPKCGSLGPYTIVCSCDAYVTDECVGETQNFEWNPDSACTCASCGHDATVRDFYIKAEEAETAE